jgi:hypothetical protein
VAFSKSGPEKNISLFFLPAGKHFTTEKLFPAALYAKSQGSPSRPS